MKKGKGRISKITLMVFSLLTIGSAGMMMANAAGNISNTDFTYYWQLGMDDLYTDATEPRAKLDDTSSMMACKTGSRYTASVWAVTDHGQYIDKSRGHSYLFTANSSTYMLNWVYEDGYDLASIVGYLVSDSNRNTTSTGFWSPDSI